MKKLFIGFLALGSISLFASEIHCTDKGPYGLGQAEDPSVYTMKFNLQEQSQASFVLTEGLSLRVQASSDKGLWMTVGKNVSFAGGGAWNPIASTNGNGEVKLMINRNAIAGKIFFGGYDFPEKKLGESKAKFFKRLKDYLEKENDQPLIDAFNKKYGELAIFHCKMAL